MKQHQKILIVVSTKAFLVSHRYELVEKLKSMGHEVIVLTGSSGSVEMDKQAADKFDLLDIKAIEVKTSGRNFIIAVFNIFHKIYVIKPSIIHIITFKMYLFCSLALLTLTFKKTVVALSGLGFAGIIRKGVLGHFKSSIFKLILKMLISIRNNQCIILQNTDDLLLLSNYAPKRTELVLISGSGVDFSKYIAKDYDEKSNIVLFAGRLLYDKGLIEFIEAAKILEKKFKDWKFVISGSADYNNPSGISRTKMEKLLINTNIEWRGYSKDISSLVMDAKVVCLPSYREGLPKFLVEGAACGACLVTTDTPGCRDIVTNRYNGLLCEAMDIVSLHKQLRTAMSDNVLSKKLGLAALKNAIAIYDVNEIVVKTIQCYGEI